MIIGDEYVLIRSVGGTLPDELEGRPLLVVPVAIRRLRRTYERESEGVPQRGGQITRVLDGLPRDALDALFDPEPHHFRELSLDELRPTIATIEAEAAAAGFPLPPVSALYAAAARQHDAPIWLGHDRNLPRWVAQGYELAGVRWHLVSELESELVREPGHQRRAGRSLSD